MQVKYMHNNNIIISIIIIIRQNIGQKYCHNIIMITLLSFFRKSVKEMFLITILFQRKEVHCGIIQRMTDRPTLLTVADIIMIWYVIVTKRGE